jgi:hypothetical protein
MLFMQNSSSTALLPSNGYAWELWGIHYAGSVLQQMKGCIVHQNCFKHSLSVWSTLRSDTIEWPRLWYRTVKYVVLYQISALVYMLRAGIAQWIGYGLDDQGIGVRVPAGAKPRDGLYGPLSLLYNGHWGLFPLRRDANRTPPSSAEVKNAGAIPLFRGSEG